MLNLTFNRCVWIAAKFNETQETLALFQVKKVLQERRRNGNVSCIGWFSLGIKFVY